MKKTKKFVDEDSQRQFRTFVLLFIGIIGFMIFAGGAAFLLTIEGAEKTLVPDIVGESLEDAMLTLQEKELNARIQLQYSSTPGDKGTVLAQDPTQSSLLRAGSQVLLRVSKGAVIDRVENYIGWDIDDLRLHLQTLFTTHGPLLRVAEPVVKVFDDADPGVILEQKPEPGTEISGLTDLQLVVSRGPAGISTRVAEYTGLTYQQALERLTAFEVPFAFSSRGAEGEEEPGTVVSQDPPPGTERGLSEGVELVMTKPEEIPEDYVFGVLQRTLPDYPIIVDIALEAITPTGGRETVITFKHAGGEIGIPYVVEENTMLVLLVFDKEILRYTVSPEEPEEPEQQ